MPTDIGFTVRIYNRRDPDIPDDAIYVGRPTPYGNPWRVGRDGTRSEVIQKFREYLHTNEHLKKMVRENLAGKHLICYCAPQPCHAEVLAEYANNLPEYANT